MNPQLFRSQQNVIVQGITGTHGTFHAKAMIAAGTHIIAGTSPNKAGQSVDGIPVYTSIADIRRDHDVDTSVIFVPAPFARGAILEAINAEIPLIVCITEGIPVHDMLEVRRQLQKSSSTLIGPNCPGVLLPNLLKLGIIPASIAQPGSVGVVSRSGTLTYEVVASLSAQNIGQRYIIGIGGDPVRGTNFIDCLKLFEKDPDVSEIVLIGEIGGTDEQLAAQYIKEYISKPVYAYVTGHHAPEGVQLGHAGAILATADESAGAKTTELERAGAVTASTLGELIDKLQGDITKRRLLQ